MVLVSLLSSILKISQQRYPGPSPGFDKAHTLMVLMMLGQEKAIGRQSLSERTGLGQGSVRTILKRLRREGYLVSDIQGCHLTELGRNLYSAFLRKLVGPVSLNGASLTVGSSHSAILVRSSGPSPGIGIKQRDSAVHIGASGATTYVIKAGKFQVPGGSDNCEKDFPSKAWVTLREKLGPRNGDIVIVCGATEETTAKLGAISAALTLI